jgi:hypothetical protein
MRIAAAAAAAATGANLEAELDLHLDLENVTLKSVSGKDDESCVSHHSADKPFSSASLIKRTVPQLSQVGYSCPSDLLFFVFSYSCAHANLLFCFAVQPAAFALDCEWSLVGTTECQPGAADILLFSTLFCLNFEFAKVQPLKFVIFRAPTETWQPPVQFDAHHECMLGEVQISLGQLVGANSAGVACVLQSGSGQAVCLSG